MMNEPNMVQWSKIDEQHTYCIEMGKKMHMKNQNQ